MYCLHNYKLDDECKINKNKTLMLRPMSHLQFYRAILSRNFIDKIASVTLLVAPCNFVA